MFLVIPIVASASTIPATDFSDHYRYALQLPSSVHLGHVLYYASVLFFHKLVPQPWAYSVNVLSMLTFMSPLLLILFAMLKHASKGHIRDSALVILSLSLFVIAPLYILPSNPYMTSYVNPTVWHSPTYHTLRLFILPLSILALRTFDGSSYRNLNQRTFVHLLAVCLVCLATLAKPSYIIVLVPGLCLIALVRSFRRQPVDWTLLVLGMLLPSALMLFLQYLVNFGSGDSGIQLGLFAFHRQLMPLWQIPIKLFLSLGFPLSVYGLYFEEARKHRYLNMSWFVMLLALMLMYFVNVTGWRSPHFVFNWCAYSAIFVLMVASVQFLIERYLAQRLQILPESRAIGVKPSMRSVVVTVIFVAHVIFGIIYFFRFQSFPV